MNINESTGGEDEEESIGGVVDEPEKGEEEDSPGDVTGSDKTQLLNHINSHRATHEVGQVRWDNGQEIIARGAVAEICRGIKGHQPGRLHHKGKFSSKTSLYSTTKVCKGVSCMKKAIDEFMSERDRFCSWGLYGASRRAVNAATREHAWPIGHFTHMVWKSHDKFGAAWMYCPCGLSRRGNTIVAVANTGGKAGGDYKDNVFPGNTC